MANKLSFYWERKQMLSASFVLVFAIIGVIILFVSHAATPYAAIEAETGAAGGATSVVDSKASGGNYLQFGTESSGGGGTTGTSGGCTSGSTVAPCIGSATTGASGWGKPVFDDEFNESSLDTSDWSTGWFGSGITGDVGALSLSPPVGDCNDPKQLSFDGSELTITLIKQTETCSTKGTTANWPYTTGMITTMTSGGGGNLYAFTYGYFEARIWMQSQNGNSNVANWPSWWLQTDNDGGSTAPYGEIDILEGLGEGPCWHVHGYNGDTDAGGCPSGTWTNGWHTFAVNWEPGTATFYYDGINEGSVSSSDLDSPNTEAARLIVSQGLNSDETAPSVMKIDYVRVWASSNTVVTQ